MSLKTILCHVALDDRLDARLDIACELALAHDAHLAGLYVIPNPYLPIQAASAYIPAELVEAQRTRGEEDAGAAEERFVGHTTRNGVNGEWRTANGETARAVGLHARYADVTIVGQDSPQQRAAGAELPSMVAMMAARPVIVVPAYGSYHDIGKRVLVCWNASREATRAVNDALPLLRAADAVTVLAVNPDQGGAHGELPGADIALFLARHGVQAEANKTHVEDIEVGELILSRASDFGADLIVMGAYGHSRLQEWVFGGVTRTLLSAMTRPVLISH